MKTFKKLMLVAAIVAMPAQAQGVLGEKLDSGLGMLPKTYTAWEYMPAGRVLGESLDSGLGDLPSTYTAWEFMPEGRLLGESLDSGLGQLTLEDIQHYTDRTPLLRTAVAR